MVQKKQDHYDLVVIGSGGGAKLARPAAEQGYKVALIEEGPLGGTCLNRGCIPSKLEIYPAEIIALLETLSKHFIALPSYTVNFSQLVRSVSRTVDAKSRAIEDRYCKESPLTLFQSHAHFLDDHHIRVEGKVIRGDKIILAVGAKPAIPSIKGLEKTPYMTSKEALRCKQLPKEMILIGGGYIATELGFFFSAMGTNVRLFLRSDQILRHEDCEIREAFAKDFQKRVELNYNIDFEEVVHKKGRFTLSYYQNKRKKEACADALFIATGITPLTKDLGLENTHVTLDKRGYIEVDRFLRTRAPHIWAFGDCIGRYPYRHTANFEGEYLYHNLFVAKKKSAISYPPVPHAIFSEPQIASVGKTEDEAKREKLSFFTLKSDYNDTGRGMAMKSDTGFIKLLFAKGSKRLIGAHIIGPEASTLIHVLIAFMNMKATLADLQKAIYIHPSLAEVIRYAVR